MRFSIALCKIQLSLIYKVLFSISASHIFTVSVGFKRKRDSIAIVLALMPNSLDAQIHLMASTQQPSII